MTNRLNSDILTEQELNDLKLNQYKHQFGINQEVEKFIRDLPYNDDFPRYYHNKKLKRLRLNFFIFNYD